MSTDREPLSISGLQHLAFCPRQWGLIELRDGTRIVRGLLLESRRMRITGRSDVVEFRPAPFPIEYKRGKAKPTDCDAVQLCAQALCLEEMLGTSIPCGAIFYGEPRRRTEVTFDVALRHRTRALAEQMHELHFAGVTPAAKPGPHCRNCSLVSICLPQATSGERSARRWFENVTARRWREE